MTNIIPFPTKEKPDDSLVIIQVIWDKSTGTMASTYNGEFADLIRVAFEIAKDLRHGKA